MGVHVDSVIPTWVNDYRPDFYTSLTDKEEYTYTTYPGKKAAWMTEFTNLSTAMTNWKNENREDPLGSLISSVHTYLQLYLNFGVSGSYLASMDAFAIFNINNFIDDTLARAINYYNDMPNDPPYDSPKINANITKINNDTYEDGHIATAQANSKAVAGPFVANALFVDVLPIGPAGATRVTAPGSGYTDGVYTNIALTTVSGPGAGAQAGTIQVSGGEVVLCVLGSTKGSAYKPNTVVTATLPGGTGFQATVVAVIGAGKQDVGEYIFNTLNYKKVYEILNVGGLTLPPYIT